MTWLKRIIIVVVILGVAGAALGWYFGGSSAAVHQYRTDTVQRGDVVAAIGATGTVEPDEVIDIGAQVNGTILAFGKDTRGGPIDYGSTVEAGALLAQIDDVTYRSAVTEASATLEQSKAGVTKANADVATATAKLYQAQRDWERAEKIGSSDALAQTTYDNYRSTYDQAVAAVAVANAEVEQAKATVDQSDSALKGAQRNLDYCTINSPVRGTIIDRRVNIGQTMVSNLSASSMFLLAKDLTKMQLWVAVNEADIGNIKQGQAATFTVDAFNGVTFKGVVNKVRLNASMTQNVVTYTVEVNTDNSDGKLMPYLTANVQFEVSRHEGVLTVPNAALRWSPSQEEIIPSARKESQGMTWGPPGEGATGAVGPTTAPARDPNNRPGTLWVKEGDLLKPISVRAGATDGSVTEVRSDDIKDGLEIITGEIVSGAGPTTGTNPFLPQIGKRH